MTLSPQSPQVEAMRRLRERFESTIDNTLDAFRQLARQLGERPDAPEVVNALRRELHRVHGTAGSYGYAEASALAARVEALAVSWSRDVSLQRGERATIVEHFASALELAFKRAGASASDAAEQVADIRTIVVVGLAHESALRLRLDAAERGIRAVSLEMGQVGAELLKELRPILLAAPPELARQLTETAWMLGLPVVGLELRSPDSRTSSIPRDAGVSLVDVAAGFGPLFDVAEHAMVRSPLAGATILALDDDPSILAIVSYVLTRSDVRVATISDPAQLAEALATYLPSLLLMDISMPPRSGIDIARELRADPHTRDLPIVLLSGETDARQRDEALRAGADEFISKPIAVSELRGRIGDRLDRHRLQRLAAGLHPVTGLPAGARAARDELQLLDHGGEDAACNYTVVVVRPARGDADDVTTTTWPRELLRVSRALEAVTRFAGHLENDALLLVLTLSAADAASRLAALDRGRSTDAPAWHAGFVALSDAPRREIASARRCAEEAVDVARVNRELVHRWQSDEALFAPDVIVVEDDPALSDMLQYALRATGFAFRAFSNGRVALDFLIAAKTQGRRPIVLLDVDLPGLDGYSLHEELAVARAGEYSVVFVTVHGAETDQLRALAGGAVDFVQKPLNLRILMAKMRSWTTITSAGTRS